MVASRLARMSVAITKKLTKKMAVWYPVTYTTHTVQGVEQGSDWYPITSMSHTWERETDRQRKKTFALQPPLDLFHTCAPQ